MSLKHVPMLPEPLNLLPGDRIRAFRRRYFSRLAVLTAIILAVLSGIHGILLLPTHVLLMSQIAERSLEARALASASSTDPLAFETRLSSFAANAKRLLALSKSPSATGTLSLVLGVPREGVTFSSLAYSQTSKGKPQPQVVLTGVAETRDDLRRYQLALQEASFVSAAELPVSTYARETNLPFTITVILKTP